MNMMSIVGASSFFLLSLFFLADNVLSTPAGLCLEKIGNGSYLAMAPHPDDVSNRAFFSNQQGKIWLAKIPEQGSGGVIEVDEVSSPPMLNLSDIVYSDGRLGLMSIALHPNFTQNGRFFATFSCDKTHWAECTGRCACNADVGCDPSNLLPPYNTTSTQLCQYHSVISEFFVNTSSNSTGSPTEVRRIFSMGLPTAYHHGSQILFGPDGYLYFLTGEGGEAGDPYKFSQNKKSLLGKILRLDVDNLPSGAEISGQDLWGNYSIPIDNPYSKDNQSRPELWAFGLRNPWRCSFDTERPSYFLCGDIGHATFEEVDVITKGWNYGWSVYEGPFVFNSPPLPNTSYIFPVMGYHRYEITNSTGNGTATMVGVPAAIVGGYFYRSLTDPFLYGRYLYGDLYKGPAWAGIEYPQDSGNFTSIELSFSCAVDSPMQCSTVVGSSTPVLGNFFSYGEDLNKDVYVLTSSGVYRIVHPSRCNHTCLGTNISTNNTST